MRRPMLVRVLLFVLAWPAFLLGVWATLAPRNWYENFPGVGQAWIAIDGSFNEHLIRDVGALNLALVTVTLVALVKLDRTLVRTTAAAWLVYSLPHLLYHATHTDPFDTGDAIAALGGLTLDVVVPIVLLVLARPDPDPVRPEPVSGVSAS
jgi:hypothetical protein